MVPDRDTISNGPLNFENASAPASRKVAVLQAADGADHAAGLDVMLVRQPLDRVTQVHPWREPGGDGAQESDSADCKLLVPRRP